MAIVLPFPASSIPDLIIGKSTLAHQYSTFNREKNQSHFTRFYVQVARDQEPLI